MNELIQRYNRPAPRYTSYPPANFFSVEYGEMNLLEAVEASNKEGIRNLSFYIHVPFCPQLCHYCACNAYSMEGKAAVERYMQAVLQELEMVCSKLDKTRPITQIHYGGGTPTAIPLHYLAKINVRLMSLFPLADGAEIAIECHPGYLSLSGWQELIDAGFNRFSLGVQDFSEEVLKAVNRRPSRERYEDIFAILRKAGVSINLDLIYGLPRQTVESFSENIRRAIELGPDRLVTFSYAHVPWVKPAQNILAQMGLPTQEQKTKMFSVAKELLSSKGYKSVGLDHFVKPDDALWIAQEEKMLHRNFQGYCTRATTGQVYAFGVTAISQLSSAFAQNTKSIPDYVETVEAGHIPIERGYRLNPSEQIAAEAIASIMCNYRVLWEDLQQQFTLSREELLETLYFDESTLRSLERDQLIVWSDDGIEVLEPGRIFVRIVASALDPLFQSSSKNQPYSMAL